MKGFLYLPRLFKKRSNEDRLVMTILCRNEVDIIEHNVRVHSALGVDAFIVMDNGSTDGTREKLDELSREFELKVVDQTGVYQQAKWMRQLAFMARDEMAASWVISNDADEFWIPQEIGKTLKSFLRHQDSVVTVPRSNMLLTEDIWSTKFHFSQLSYRVKHPICYDEKAELSEQQVSMFFANISPKVIVNPYGFIKISGGNHRAKHLAKLFTARQEPGIRVYHYPIRSFQQFEANIRHRQQLLKKPKVRMGDHYRRWVRLLEQGSLEEEFQRFVVINSDKAVLEKYGLIIEDHRSSDKILQTLSGN